MRQTATLLCVLLAAMPAVASASETITYNYDAKGRLIQVKHAGTVNDGVVSTYQYDAADNRHSVTTTRAVYGSSSAPIVVVPLGGLTVIPLAPTPQ